MPGMTDLQALTKLRLACLTAQCEVGLVDKRAIWLHMCDQAEDDDEIALAMSIVAGFVTGPRDD